MLAAVKTIFTVATEQFYALVFLKQAGNHFDDCHRDLNNDFLKGSGHIPETVDNVYALLQNYETHNKHNSNSNSNKRPGWKQNGHGVTWAKDTEETDPNDFDLSNELGQDSYYSAYQFVQTILNPYYIKDMRGNDRQSVHDQHVLEYHVLGECSKKKPLELHTNTGTAIIDKIGNLPGVGTVWEVNGFEVDCTSRANKAGFRGLYYLNCEEYFGVDKTNTVFGSELYNTHNDTMGTMESQQVSISLMNRTIETVEGNKTKFTNQDVQRDSPFVPRGVKMAKAVLGQSVYGLKGKWTKRKNDPVEVTELMPLQITIKEHYKEVTVAADVMRVNQCLYKQFEGLVNTLVKTRVEVNMVSRDEHVPEIKRFIRVIKERARASYAMLPFDKIPRKMVVSLLDTIGTDNTMRPRTVGVIALGPVRNIQGGVKFFSLQSGEYLDRSKSNYTILPMLTESIKRVERMAHRSRGGLTFLGDRNNKELEDSEPDTPPISEHDHIMLEDSSSSGEDHDLNDESTNSRSSSTDDSNDDDPPSDPNDSKDNDSDDDDPTTSDPKDSEASKEHKKDKITGPGNYTAAAMATAMKIDSEPCNYTATIQLHDDDNEDRFD
eukprot:jgi/Psemu1/37685/gm1.37685_g